MIRGTTPTITFDLDVDAAAFDEIWVTFAQDGAERFTIEREGLEIQGSTITVTLTQEQTLMLADDVKVEMQIRAKYADGTALASDIVNAKVGRILKDGEI